MNEMPVFLQRFLDDLHVEGRRDSLFEEELPCSGARPLLIHAKPPRSSFDQFSCLKRVVTSSAKLFNEELHLLVEGSGVAVIYAMKASAWSHLSPRIQTLMADGN